MIKIAVKNIETSLIDNIIVADSLEVAEAVTGDTHTCIEILDEEVVHVGMKHDLENGFQDLNSFFGIDQGTEEIPEKPSNLGPNWTWTNGQWTPPMTFEEYQATQNN